MDEKRTLRPRTPDLIVRKPETGLPLDVNGEEVVMNTFWRRRLKDGDVIEMKAQKPKPDPKAPAAA
ncbi:MAG: DUF2635 domain-containing protein [Gammaproteobacteria bacterium]